MVLLADGNAQASCADADGDGSAGLVRLAISLEDGRSRETLTAVVTPETGDVDERGRYRAKLHLDTGRLSERSFDAWLQAVPSGRR